MKVTRLTVLSAALLIAGVGIAGAQQTTETNQVPDKIYYGGPIVTMNDKALMAEAVAIRNGKIIAVDRLRTIKAMADDKTERIDLKGKTMMPGFIDAHSHFLATGSNALLKVDLNSPPIGDVKSI